jgi:pilus assembly protein Flp/PilA
MMKELAVRVWRDDTGATAIEYALIASGIALAITVPLLLLSGTLDSTYQTIGSYLSS